jgi:hypothetical protein
MKVSSDIQRRLLVNYRADPSVIAGLLPHGLQPALVNGWAVVGICLIRLAHIRPYGLPAAVGITTENAAHRIAVEWETEQGKRPGVYIPRRDTASRATVLLGGRLFAGVHQRGQFESHETPSRVRVRYATLDHSVAVDAEVELTVNLNGSRLFDNLDEASTFFRTAPVGLSPGRDDRVEAMELTTDRWQIEPAVPVRVSSSWFDDRARFPAGSVTLDSALVMRNVPVTWSGVTWEGGTPRAASAARTA